MEKGLVVVLLCCAGALVAESMSSEEQRKVLELLQQELAEANALEGKQKVGFPTNTEEQEIENAKEQQLTNNGVVYTRWGSSAW